MHRARRGVDAWRSNARAVRSSRNEVNEDVGEASVAPTQQKDFLGYWYFPDGVVLFDPHKLALWHMHNGQRLGYKYFK